MNLCPSPHLLKLKMYVIYLDHFNSQLFSQSSHVIGSGISAAHLTLKVLKLDKNKIVHLWMNKNIDIQHLMSILVG